MKLTVRDAAKLLNVSEKTIYRWISQEAIPFQKINEQFRFNRAELLEWATARKIQVSPEIFSEESSNGSPLPTLTEALRNGGIAYRINGDDKPSVLKSVVSAMNLPDEVDREFLFQVLLAREALASTGIGDGIAIPHVRNPIVLHINKPSITLCFLEKAIEFGAIDGKPVSVLFTMVSPTVRAHLHMLSRLTFALRNDWLKNLILSQAGRDEIFSAFEKIDQNLISNTKQ
ncbi:MAG: PTS sugar transporter subunit IIA [Candidatus Nanoarchaeia archaeon]